MMTGDLRRDMSILTTTTLFAPAERASQQTIDRQTTQLEQLDLLQHLCDAALEIVMVLNSDRQIVFCNDSLARLLGMDDRRRLYGLRPGEALRCIHACDGGSGCGTTEFCSQCGATQAVLSGLQGRADVKECQLTQIDHGEGLELLVRATPLIVAGEPFVIVAGTDVSHEKRRDALERVFFHDLLNTVTGITMLAEDLSEIPPEDLPPVMEGIQSGVSRMVNEILAQRDLMAAERQELAVRPAPMQSVTFLEQLLRTCRSYEVIRGCRLQLDEDAQDVAFQSDSALLGRVLSNMIKNAAEACHKGDTVTIGCQRNDGRVEFWVHNPAFIPRNAQLRLFQRSFSTKGVGRGLGTYSMKLLTDQYLEGRITFVTSESDGTVFTANYPLVLRRCES